MAQVASLVASRLSGLLRTETGLPFVSAQIAAREGLAVSHVPVAQVVQQYVAADTAEKSTGAAYPSVHVYCEKLSNTLREKFRTFSGTVTVVMEIRVSHDRLAGLEQSLRHQVEAVTQVLDFSRGDWGGGMFFTGPYTVEFAPVKHGGKNYIQTARVTAAIDVSVD